MSILFFPKYGHCAPFGCIILGIRYNIGVNSQYLTNNVLPDEPGVYFFKQGTRILYIGKATSLRSRVRSYFSNDLISTRGSRIVDMVTKADSLDFEVTDSVLEALIAEANLIKKHQPFYNAREKDDKSYNYVVITKEDFPRVLLVRGRELEMQTAGSGNLTYKIKHTFGPFPEGASLREGLRIIRKIFPYRDRCEPASGKSCFNYQIGLCPGVCNGVISKQEYKKRIQHIVHFFEGNKKKIYKTLEADMMREAALQHFEKAEEIKRTLRSLQHIHDVSLLKRDFDNGENADIPKARIEAYDIAHTSGMSAVGVMVVVQGSIVEKKSYRKFIIRGEKGNSDSDNLREVLQRRLAHTEWQLPDIFVVDGGDIQKNVFEKVLKDVAGGVSVVSVVKDSHHKPKAILGDAHIIGKYKKEILLANSESHRFALSFHRKRRDIVRQ